MHKKCKLHPLLTVWGSHTLWYCKLGARARARMCKKTHTHKQYESHSENKLWSGGLLRPHFPGWVLYHCPASPRRLCQIIASFLHFFFFFFQERMSLFPGNRVQGQVCLTRRDAHSCQDLGFGAWLRPSRSHAWFGHVHTALTRSPLSPTSGRGVSIQFRHLDCPCRFHLQDQPTTNCSVCHHLASEKVVVSRVGPCNASSVLSALF